MNSSNHFAKTLCAAIVAFAFVIATHVSGATVLHFGVDGDINGGNAGGEGSGIAGNGNSNGSFGPTIAYSFSAPTAIAPDATLELGSTPAAIGIQSGPGITPSFGGNQKTNDFSYISHDSNTLAGSIGGNDYIFFRLTIDAGFQLNLDGYQFEVWRNGGQAVENYAVFHGASGFTAVAGSEDASKSISQNAGGSGTPSAAIDTTGALQSVGVASGLNEVLTGTVEFRLYGWQGASGTTNGNTHFDAAQVFGTVTEIATVIPTPAALPAGLALLGLAAARRRR